VAGKSYDRIINGSAGDVKLLGVTGTDWSWGSSSHAWAEDSDDQVKRQARRSRLIKDVSLLWPVRPNRRIHAQKTRALLSGSESGRGFGSVSHHQKIQALSLSLPLGLFAFWCSCKPLV